MSPRASPPTATPSTRHRRSSYQKPRPFYGALPSVQPVRRWLPMPPIRGYRRSARQRNCPHVVPYDPMDSPAFRRASRESLRAVKTSLTWDRSSAIFNPMNSQFLWRRRSAGGSLSAIRSAVAAVGNSAVIGCCVAAMSACVNTSAEAAPGVTTDSLIVGIDDVRRIASFDGLTSEQGSDVRSPRHTDSDAPGPCRAVFELDVSPIQLGLRTNDGLSIDIADDGSYHFTVYGRGQLGFDRSGSLDDSPLVLRKRCHTSSGQTSGGSRRTLQMRVPDIKSMLVISVGAIRVLRLSLGEVGNIPKQAA